MRARARQGFLLGSDDIRNDIFVPRYYDPAIAERLEDLAATHDLLSLQEMASAGWLEFSHGKYVPKALYGTGDVPYVRTSDIANWELKGSPKHGIDEAVYLDVAPEQDVRAGDILYVHEGTYLIGTPCLVTRFDTRILYQHHLAKLRVCDEAPFSAPLLLAGLLTPIVLAQVRARQFTADVIDSIVGRLPEIVVPLPRDPAIRQELEEYSEGIFTERAASRVRLAVLARGLDGALKGGTSAFLENCDSGSSPDEDVAQRVVERLIAVSESEGLDAVVSFLGAKVGRVTFIESSEDVESDILVPHYYDPTIKAELSTFDVLCELRTIESLVRSGILELQTGVEVGKLAYGEGDIPFIRTSDFGNWELKHDPKHRVSVEVYDQYSESASAQDGDVLLVRDGTYLVGTSVLVVEDDPPMLFSGGIYRIRSLDHGLLPPSLLLRC